MNEDGYRSYVVRIRRQHRGPAEPDVVRAEVEDLLGGMRARVDDARAGLLAADLESMLGAPSARPRPDLNDLPSA